MLRKKLPVPLILLIPICLLLTVIVSGLYRFSLSDEEILAKFPSHQSVVSDPIVETILNIRTPNPWTIQIPNLYAFSLLTKIDADKQIAQGHFDDGREKGQVEIHYSYMQSVSQSRNENDELDAILIPFIVQKESQNGVYYLGVFHWDEHRQRVVLSDAKLIGEHIEIMDLTSTHNALTLRYRTHDNPTQSTQSQHEKSSVSKTDEFSYVGCEVDSLKLVQCDS